MNDAIEPRKTKERSPSFPFISLEAAIDRARQFYAQEKRSGAPFPVAAEHWGYSQSSSGALQTASALKNYGLMVDEGGGGVRKLKLTDLALRILLDTRPDDSDRRQYMRQAALYPSVAADIYSKWPEGLPSESTINHYLVLELGFNQSTALRAVRIIIDNERVTKSSIQENHSYDSKNDSNDPETYYPAQQQPTPPSTGRLMEMAFGKSDVIRTERVIDPDGLDVLVQFSGQPTVASYEFLKDYIELRIKALRRTDALANKDET